MHILSFADILNCYIFAFIPAPPALSLANPVALAIAVDAALVLGAAGAAIELQNARAGLKQAQNNLAQSQDRLNRARANNPNTGDKQGDPPFKGGQTQGLYDVKIRRKTSDGDVPWATVGLRGKIGGLYKVDVGSGQKRVYILYNSGSLYNFNTESQGLNFYIASVNRVDGGLDDGGDPSGAGIEPSGYKGGNGDRLEDRQGRQLAPPPSPLGTPSGKSNSNSNSDKKPSVAPNPTNTGSPNNFNFNINTNLGGALGLGNGTQSGTNNFAPPETFLPPPEGKKLSPPPQKQPPPPKPPLQEPPPPQPERKEEEKKITPPPPKSPPPENQNNNNDILNKLAQILGITALINTNTQPDAQRLNAKNGSCDALNSPECTSNLKNDIKEPILDKVNQNAGAISALGSALSGINTFLTNSIFPKLVKIQEFAEGVARAAKLDKVYNFLTFLTVIHNAQMLSNNLLQTLESTISQGLAVLGIKDGDSPIDINAIINKSTSDLLKSVLGETRYNELDSQWKSANKIYQSGANLVYQVRSLYDSSKATAELTGANLGQLMNALKKDGVVTESAYPNKSESPSQVNSLMDRLQNLESAASHLNSITSNAYGITETVKQIKDDKAAFDKLVEDSPLKKGIQNKAATNDAAAKKLASPSPPLSTTDLVKPD